MKRTYTIFLRKTISFHPRVIWKIKKILTEPISSDKASEIMDLCRLAGWDVSMFWYNWP